MGRQRDPKRDKAYEIYKASGGKINLNVKTAKLTFGEHLLEPDEHIMTPIIGGVTIKRGNTSAINGGKLVSSF